MHELRELGVAEVLERALSRIGEGRVFLSVDVDVLDPAFALGTGTPEPGGMAPIDLLCACRTAGARLDLAGADVVEVSPTASCARSSPASRSAVGSKPPDPSKLGTLFRTG